MAEEEEEKEEREESEKVSIECKLWPTSAEPSFSFLVARQLVTKLEDLALHFGCNLKSE